MITLSVTSFTRSSCKEMSDHVARVWGQLLPVQRDAMDVGRSQQYVPTVRREPDQHHVTGREGEMQMKSITSQGEKVR